MTKLIGAFKTWFILFTTVFYYTNLVSSDYPSHWVQPNAYSRSTTNDHQLENINAFKCPSPNQNDDEEYGQFLYKKLANYLLDRKQMIWNKEHNRYDRKLHLIISSEQYNNLKTLTKSQDIDAVLSEILFQSKSSAFDNAKESLFKWWEFIFYTFNYSSISWHIIQFVGCIALWFASRWYKFNFLIVIGIFVMYLLYAAVDAECNRKLDIEKMVALMDQEKDGNLCDIKSYGFFQYYFGNPKSNCKEYLSKHYNARETCSMVQNFKEAINIFIYELIFTFMHNIAKVVRGVYVEHGFILTIIISLLFVFIFYHFGITIIVSFFKYFLHSFMDHLFHRSTNNSTINQQPSIDGNHHDTMNKLIDLANQHVRLSETIINQKSNNDLIAIKSNQKLLMDNRENLIEEIPLTIEDKKRIDSINNQSNPNEQIVRLQLEIEKVHKLISHSANNGMFNRNCDDFSKNGILLMLDTLYSQDVVCSNTKRLAQLYLKLLDLVVDPKVAETTSEKAVASSILGKTLYSCQNIDKGKLTTIEFSVESQQLFDDLIPEKIEDLIESKYSHNNSNDTSDDTYEIL